MLYHQPTHKCHNLLSYHSNSLHNMLYHPTIYKYLIHSSYYFSINLDTFFHQPKYKVLNLHRFNYLSNLPYRHCHQARHTCLFLLSLSTSNHLNTHCHLSKTPILDHATYHLSKNLYNLILIMLLCICQTHLLCHQTTHL
jgi:hypothetical protein